MRFSTTAALVMISALGASALPAMLSKKQAANIDPVILQYALTLEHLENAFYKKALSTWTLEAFTAQGFSAELYEQLKYVTHDEESHVVYLTAGLKAAGAEPVAPCTYNFPMTSPGEFIKLASIIEGVGVSAYLGAAPSITEKAYLTAAGSILVTEALHQSKARDATGKIPFANPNGTPLGLNPVFSIASQFIVSCPSTNEPLPLKVLPGLTLVSGLPTAQAAQVDLRPANPPSGTVYATFVSGLTSVSVPVTASGDLLSAIVPADIEGQSYVFLTSDDSGAVTDDNTVAGPAILEVTPSSPTFDLNIQ
ncbi:ferritin-like domain-containing protein [Bisporella sp. PMI_857]|nr:ferritin-like domain-containing protein [Bisporella sp. PMI_857]